jgi:predicted GNAT family acetyltransferase
MSADIEFKSHVPMAQRPALEALLYFNACQERVSDSIANAVEKFGAPEIVADRDRLRIYLKNYPEVQSLFALERATGKPIGVAVYMRQDVEHITVMHVGVAAEYASGGMRAGAQLLLRLLREVRRSARRVKGVRSLELYYATDRSHSNRWRDAAKAAI